MPLTSKQLDYLMRCNHRWNVKIGATGSGKSFVDYTVTIAKRVLACRGEGLIVLMGNTRGTLDRNILEPMREFWPGLVSDIHSDNTVDIFGRKCYALGADNKKHVARIQGATFEYVYGDEVTTWSEDVFSMLKSRLRCKHSHFDGTCNPDSPKHWFKTFLDSNADIYQQEYNIDDGALPAEIVANLKKEYAGTVYYARFILGKWAAAEGIIYRQFADSCAAGDGQFTWDAAHSAPLWKVQIGVDFGGNGSRHAFVAVGTLPSYSGAVVLQSRRVNAAGTDADALAREFFLFAHSVFLQYGRIDRVLCDSAEQVLIQHLRSAACRYEIPWIGEKIWNAKKIMVNDRIRLVCILMGGGRFWVAPEAESARDALSSALWSGKHPGIDERLDDGTTDIDTLDALEYALERDYKRYLGLDT